MLNTLVLDISYRSDTSDVVTQFYVPCLEKSVLYRRAAGYFTSNGLSLAAKGIAHLIRSGGRIRLVASPFLTDTDLAAITAGYQSRDEILRAAATRDVEHAKTELEKDRLAALAWLISIGALDIKLAFRVEPYTGRVQRGIYHEKIGIFTDVDGNSVAFTGSQNETAGGLVENFESIDVFCSWLDRRRVDRKARDFDALWANKTSGLAVVDFTDVSHEILQKFKTSTPPDMDPEERAFDLHSPPHKRGSKPTIPNSITLRSYQTEAANNWLKNNGKGILQLATGTGKTITALGIASNLAKRAGLQGLIVVCPFKHLVSQWAEECRRFYMEPILAYEERAAWYDVLTTVLSAASRSVDEFVCVIATNATFASEGFQQRLKYFPKTSLLVVDEVHNVGAERLTKALPSSITLRLGLSATPERWFDPEGTNRLTEYFGPILEPRIGIKEAIELKALVPYRYYPILIELTDEERIEYLEISARIAKAFRTVGFDEDNPSLKMLSLERARLVASASNKMVALRELGAFLQHQTQMLFYCGDGRVDNPDEDYNRRQIEEVTKVLGSELLIKVAIYDQNTETKERDSMRKDLATGQLQGLVAIRCLDEGVDIPSVKTAVVLASSSNPRQFIQRRGRVLRVAPGKSHADIYDMIVVPPREVANSESERSLVRKELIRFREFADLAMNAGEALGKVLELQKHFGLMDI